MRRSVIVLGALALVLSSAGTASAEPPVEVGEQLDDRAGALGVGTSAAAERAVADLAAEDGLVLSAVFVSSFDNADPGAWARDSARLSGMDGDDLLLAVAVGDATFEYGYWVDEDFPLSEVDLERVVTAEVEPRLAAGDRSGAVVALAERLGELVAAQDEAAAEAGPWSARTTILVVVGVALVLLVAHLLSRRRSSARS
ncbi:TPM domain-containing protein [Geodermatophilus sp. DSM 44513]|uniref:TPM domain-containing protein n=1 Tax=Geodermatophilus sp. DSM 44513 TaxID=1528104 RepID=UPI00126C6609|nr:TPM domain-containing protein [Geodermatophilus sp. DSM 44513]WNV76036.1 TPM domain-containing protein [Geodermatophilus sp. DSM 44513]